MRIHRGISEIAHRFRWPFVVVIAQLLIVSVHAQPTNHQQNGLANSRKAPSIQRPAASDVIPADIQNDIHRIAHALEAANGRGNSADDNSPTDQYAKKNLEDQNAMAFWANGMFWVGFFELAITGFGVFLVWRTLIATWAAKGEAKRAADAAEKALQQADGHGRQAMRAYVSTLSRTILRTGNVVTCEIIFKNSGNTPAYKAAWDSRLWVDRSDAPIIPKVDSDTASTITIVPGGEFIHTISLLISAEDFEEIKNYTKAVWCTGLLEYLDTFGERRFLSYRFYAPMDCLVEGKAEKMYIADVGNDSN